MVLGVPILKHFRVIIFLCVYDYVLFDRVTQVQRDNLVAQ